MSDYQMRARHTVLSEYVYWESLGQPDFVGTGSGYNPGDLEAIGVVRVLVSGSSYEPGTAVPNDRPPMTQDAYTPLVVPLRDNQTREEDAFVAETMA